MNKCHGAMRSDYNGNYFEEGCNTLADGDARFCHKCGAQTTFGYFKILTPWDDEQAELITTSKTTSNEEEKFIQMASDEDLPF